MSIEIAGFFGLIVFVLNIWAIIKVMESSIESLNKLLWILLILFFPVIGLVVWFIFGPKGR